MESSQAGLLPPEERSVRSQPGKGNALSDPHSQHASAQGRQPFHVVLYYWGVGILVLGLNSTRHFIPFILS